VPLREPADTLGAPSLRSRLLSPRTVLSLGITALIIAVAVWRAPIDWHQAWSNIRHADPLLYLAGIAAYYLSFLARTLRWQVLLRNAGERCPAGPLFETLLVSFFVNCVVPAKMGDVYRAFLLRTRLGVGAMKAGGTILAERLLDLFVLMSLLLAAGVLTFRDRLPHALVPYVVAGVVLSLGGLGVLLLMARGRGRRLLGVLPEPVRQRYENFRVGTVHSFGRWPEVLLLSVLVWALESTRLAFVVYALGYGGLLSPQHFVLVALVAALLTTVPFTPGGVGLVEAGMAGVLVAVASVPRTDAVSIALLDRSISYGTLVAVGCVVFVLTHLRVPQGRPLADESSG
jgi:glycosyltransferase 2 family protein